MLDSEIEALGLLAYKRGLFYESKKDSLRQDIDRLRNFLEAMSKDRELMRKQVNVEHILCKKKLARSEKELQETQNRLRETEIEAACLLESKHVEMERLQKERDEAMAKVETLCAESCFLKGYGNHLEQKVCALVLKLHEYHQHLQIKTEEVVQTRGRAVDELEWVRQSMASFEGNLLEFQNTNVQLQLSLEKETYLKELQDMKQLERINSDKSNEGLAQADKKLYHALKTIEGLQGKVQKLECSFQSATQRAEAFSSQLDEANARISELQDQVDRLHGQLEEIQEKNLDFIKNKLEADAATQLREAAISVLKLRIYALEGDLQKEVFLRTNRLPDSHLKYLTQFSPAIDVELRARQGIIEKPIWREGGDTCVFSKTESGTSESKQQKDDESSKRSSTANIGLEAYYKKNVPKDVLPDELGHDAWSVNKMRRLEQTLAEAHQRYMLLSQEPKVDTVKSDERNNIPACHAAQQAQNSHMQCSIQDTHAPKTVNPNALLQWSQGSTEDGSASENSSEIVNQFLGNRDLHDMSSNMIGVWKEFAKFNNSERTSQHCLDRPQVRTRYVDRRYHAPYDSEMIDDYVTMPLQGLEGTSSRHSLEENTICDYSSTEE